MFRAWLNRSFKRNSLQTMESRLRNYTKISKRSSLFQAASPLLYVLSSDMALAQCCDVMKHNKFTKSNSDKTSRNIKFDSVSAAFGMVIACILHLILMAFATSSDRTSRADLTALVVDGQCMRLTVFLRDWRLVLHCRVSHSVKCRTTSN